MAVNMNMNIGKSALVPVLLSVLKEVRDENSDPLLRE